MARYSIDSDDPGHANYLRARADGAAVYVYLDDIEQLSVVTADEERGLVVKFVRNQRESFVVDGDEPKRVTLYGRVRVKIVSRVDA